MYSLDKQREAQREGQQRMFPIQQKLLTVNKYSRPAKRLRAVKGIIIHWTANEGRGANASANINFFENRKHGRTGYGSAHYFIDDKNIIRCLPDNEMAYHVGGTSYRTKHFGAYPNDCTIGIELCVNVDGDFKVVYQQGIELAAHLAKKYNLNPQRDIMRHYDITGKNCPGMFTSIHWGKTNNNYALKYGLGPNADNAWATYKNRIQSAMAGQVAAVPQKYQYDKTKGMGTLKILVGDLNIRKGNSFTAPVEQMAKKGAIFYVYEKKNNMYRVGKDSWVSAGKSYVGFMYHPGYKAPVEKPAPIKPAPSKPLDKEVIDLLKDIVGHWAENDIKFLVEKGIFSGDEKGNFNPGQPATRAHLAAVLARTIEYLEKKEK